MANEFCKSVEVGLRLSKRIYYGKEPSMNPPKLPTMTKEVDKELLPKAPMVYAVISNPAIVDNPDIRSYQPYVHGKCQPPALIPLHMYEIDVEVECYLDVAFFTVTGTWRVHCVDATKSCDCRLAFPMADQGSVLGFEIEATSGSYLTQLVKIEDTAEMNGLEKAEYGGFLKPNIFTLKIPKVDGGSKLSVKARWSQKLRYQRGRLWLSLPFSFPAYVTPGGKFTKKEKILLNVNSGTMTEVLCGSTSHPLKELRRQDGKVCLLYKEEVLTWSRTDFDFSYAVSSGDIRAGMFVQSPAPNDSDQREIFALYLFPSHIQNRRVFRKSLVFLIDISGSMQGAPFENVKQAVLASLSNLNQDDSFNIIAFNGEVHLLSSSMELATKEAVRRASRWFNVNLVPEGDTNILLPVKQALEMLSSEMNSIPFIFLVTDGAVENEKDICNTVKDYSSIKGLPLPRISTFGIGSYCNQYFLQMLAQLGRGHYDTAYDADSLAFRLQRFFTVSSSVILSNIEVDCLNHFESLELYPSTIRDLSSECPVIIAGRYRGKLPESLKIRGTLADMSNFTTDFRIQEAKDMPLDKVLARTQIDVLTSKAWFTGSKEVQEQVAEVSMKTGFPSEYIRMILVQTEGGDQGPDFVTIQGKLTYNRESLRKMISSKKLFPFQSLGIGFGDLKKTAENLPPGVIVKAPDATDLIVKAATGCCHQLLDRFCSMCFIQLVSKLSDQCVITASQICTALACCQCVDCCYDLCVNCT